MTNEASIVELWGSPAGLPLRYTAAAGDSWSKGAVLCFSSSATAGLVYAAPTGASVDSAFAGIAVEDKTTQEAATNVGAYTSGLFDMITNSTIVKGALVAFSGANYIHDASLAAFTGGAVIGKAREAAAAATEETILIEVGRL